MRLRRLMVVLSLLFSVWIWSPLKAGVVCGGSMMPTLRNGQVIVIDRSYYHDKPVSRGDVIAIRHEGEVYVKRVHSVAGDVLWELVSPGTPNLLLNPREAAKLARALDKMPGVGQIRRSRVPVAHVYVLGDATQVSRDSRDFGPVSESTIVGKVIL